MSNSMYIHKKHVVEYASSGQFNWGMDKLHHLLDASNITYSIVNDTCPEYDEDFSIPKSDIREGIENLNKIKDGEKPDFFDIDFLNQCLEESGYTLQKWIDTLQWMLDNSDPNNEDVFVEFF